VAIAAGAIFFHDHRLEEASLSSLIFSAICP